MPGGFRSNWPDLNHIENLWDYIKYKVAYIKSVNVKALADVIKDLWISEILTQYCNSLIASIPHRIETVITAKCGHSFTMIFTLYKDQEPLEL